MATVRVFLPTYRRRILLQRAVASLRAQSFQDWVCEIHNDDPNDESPHRLLSELNDPRFQLITHERNLGGTATFNLFFKPTAEPFYAMLEDDNWWEPAFLATMMATAVAHAEVTVFWANLRLWQEMPDGSFRDTGRTAWPTEGKSRKSFAWGQPAQILGALHSHGAALIRSRAGDDFTTPDVPIAAVEPFRERALPHPIMLVTAPLANFSITLQTARSRDYSEWGEVQNVLAATFLKYAELDAAATSKLWRDARAKSPASTSVLIAAALVERSCRAQLRHSQAIDWLRWFVSSCRRPISLWRILRSRSRHPEWWDYLDSHSAARFKEKSHRDVGY